MDLRLTDFTKRFGSTTVIDRLSLTVASGEMVALTGGGALRAILPAHGGFAAGQDGTGAWMLPASWHSTNPGRGCDRQRLDPAGPTLCHPSAGGVGLCLRQRAAGVRSGRRSWCRHVGDGHPPDPRRCAGGPSRCGPARRDGDCRAGLGGPSGADGSIGPAGRARACGSSIRSTGPRTICAGWPTGVFPSPLPPATTGVTGPSAWRILIFWPVPGPASPPCRTAGRPACRTGPCRTRRLSPSAPRGGNPCRTWFFQRVRGRIACRTGLGA
jgi:hypothetical protein